ncbi:Stk19 family serine/threonine-protein kinase [Aspergillus ruber CBS 135680]|uniref:Serine-threonine protein kinase 19-domain-containing protein n=1 Tax=Aspergillus ruber (strain CBS 135680) TaxID=1388766 RepID=A0A017S8K2_ASPRC|nr:uncharacterized protein EURHEDRAFT_460690 [Aspergillus ruber CBS 135680]EYE93287.1 hypothetical protein EURHEDRAFT_460690 [Aspergillus ruber CBS 135680]
MPLRLTSAPVSGIKKRKSTTTRARSSPFAVHSRTKPRSNANNTLKDASTLIEDEDFDLPDLGISQNIPSTAPATTVLDAIHHIRSTMFEDLPATRTGMNSTRIAEVLNFRSSLPPLVSVAHVHTLLDAPTRTEREIVELVTTGKVRRLIVPGRGNDAAGLGDCLVLREEWEGLVGGSGLGEELKEKFLTVLNRIGTSSAIAPGVFTPNEYQSLVRAGFLVSSSSLAKGPLGIASLPDLPPSSAFTPASRADTQSQTPNHTNITNNDESSRFHTATLFLSLPNTGPYLRLLNTSRAHLVALLKKSTHREAPLYLLRNRWDGAVETDKSFHAAKRARGEFAGILPGRTRKWKELYGMGFRWVLEEAVGAGLVEVFETGSVGPGVRCL